MNDFWDELLDKTTSLRRLFSTHHIILKPNEGLSVALQMAEDTATGKGGKILALQHDAQHASGSVLVVWSLSENIQICIDAGLDIQSHIRQIVTGTTDYGTPATSGNSSIYFKDFEYEIFLAATLIEKGLSAEFLSAGNPLGEMCCEGIIIEAKHPNSFKQLKELASKFNRNLADAGKTGFFAVALKDVFELGDVPEFAESNFYSLWLSEKREVMAVNNSELLMHVGSLMNITGLIFTACCPKHF